MDKELTKYKQQRNIGIAVLLATASVILPDIALAANELDSALTSVKGTFSGGGAKIICYTSLAFALIGCAARFSPSLIAGFIGVAIASSVGPGVIDSFVK